MNTPKRLLLVEDDPDIAEMLRYFFQEQGYTLLHAADGAEALATAYHQRPHLILMDIVLPDMDGFEVSRRLRTMPATAHIPIVFLTRHNDHGDVLAALEVGADDYVGKPFDPAELLLRVRNALRRAERNALIDHRSGLPGGTVVRQKMAEARDAADRAIIEITLTDTLPYHQQYGADRLQRVRDYLGDLVIWTLSQASLADCFAGFVDGEHLAIICTADRADAIAGRIASIFNAKIGRHYSEADRERGYMLHDGVRHPLIQAICRVHSGPPVVRIG